MIGKDHDYQCRILISRKLGNSENNTDMDITLINLSLMVGLHYLYTMQSLCNTYCPNVLSESTI